MFIYLFWKKERAWAVDSRQREREISKQAPTARVEPDMGLDLTNCEIMTWAESKSHMLNRLSHQGAPRILNF